MKSINAFFNEAPLWQVYVFGWLFTGGFTFLLFQLFTLDTELLVDIKIGLTVGLPFGLIVALTVLAVRKSQKFWMYSKEVGALIDSAETRGELESIVDNEFKTLRDLAQGDPHLSELTRLSAIIQTKYKIFKK